MDDIKGITHNNIMDILKSIDKEFLKGAISTKNFDKYFFDSCKDKEIYDFIKATKES